MAIGYSVLRMRDTLIEVGRYVSPQQILGVHDRIPVSWHGCLLVGWDWFDSAGKALLGRRFGVR